jgi:aryl-alcohol dehydrogenase-like predicted oxidoreductase
MDYRRLGTSNLQVSAVCIGCWVMGGEFWGGAEDADSIAAVQRALDVGMTFIDTAPVYGLGRSEEVVGKAIEGRRDQAAIATKVGLVWDENGKVSNCLKRDSIFREVEDSLKRLNTDVIDLLQAHWPDPNTPIQESHGAMVELYAQGKIRAIGVSNYNVAQMKECLMIGPLHSLQPPYSMLNRKIESDILPFCLSNNIAVLAYSPLQQGLLTGKITEGYVYREGDQRLNNPWFRGEKLAAVQAFLDKLRPYAQRHGVSLSQLVINWTVHQPGVTVAIVGARTPSQVDENAGGAGWRLSDQELEEIRALVDEMPQI